MDAGAIAAASPPPVRDRLRDRELWQDAEQLTKLVSRTRSDELSPQVAIALARRIARERKTVLAKEPDGQRVVATRLRYWQQDPNLASLREAETLQTLSPEERQACQRLWTEAQALLQKAQESAPR